MHSVIAITYEDAVAVTPSDGANDPAGPFAAIYTGTGGDITVVTLRGRTVLLKSTPVGETIRLAVVRVKIAGTAAANVVGFLAGPYKGPGATS